MGLKFISSARAFTESPNLPVGEFFIASNHYKDDCPEDKKLIIIEASRAFGTGEHNTTSGCIEALEILNPNQFGTILDMGTGTAILAIAAAKIWPKVCTKYAFNDIYSPQNTPASFKTNKLIKLVSTN